MLNFNSLRILALSILALSLVGCGGVEKVKQGVSESDAKFLIKMSTKDIVSDKYLKDGLTPEKAHAGVEDSLLQKYNASAGRHAINFLAGGISGLVTFGLIQSQDATVFERNYLLFNEPRLISIGPKGFEKQPMLFDEKYNVSRDVSDRTFKRESSWAYAFADGGLCSREARNCYLANIKYTIGIDYSYQDFPDGFKPTFKSNVYKVSNELIAEYGPDENGTIVRINNVQTLKNILKKDLEFSRLQSYLYLPASYNNGTPVIIDGYGNEYYFKTK